MKQFLLIIIMATVTIACATSRNKASTNLNGHWELTVFPSGDKTFAEQFNERRPELDFTLDNKVSGTTGCNRLSGNYSVQGDRFSFGNNMITTKMACSGYDESIFLEALSRVNRYTINGTELRLLQDSTVMMAFAKK